MLHEPYSWPEFDHLSPENRSRKNPVFVDLVEARNKGLVDCSFGSPKPIGTVACHTSQDMSVWSSLSVKKLVREICVEHIVVRTVDKYYTFAAPHWAFLLSVVEQKVFIRGAPLRMPKAWSISHAEFVSLYNYFKNNPEDRAAWGTIAHFFDDRPHTDWVTKDYMEVICWLSINILGTQERRKVQSCQTRKAK